MKFNHIFLSVALSAALMGSFTSCDDFLAEDPYAFVGPDQVGNDNVAVNLWVTGVYSKWANDMFRWQNFPRVLEMDCDYTSGPDWAFSNLGAGRRDRNNNCLEDGYGKHSHSDSFDFLPSEHHRPARKRKPLRRSLAG